MTMDGHEYDVDILDPKAVEGHFDRMGKAILEDAGPLAGKTLTHFYSVSWEGAVPTWTLGLEKEFQQYRGYDAAAVAAGAGRVHRARPKSRSDSCATTTGRWATASGTTSTARWRTCVTRPGLQWHSESGGPWNRKLACFRRGRPTGVSGPQRHAAGRVLVHRRPPCKRRRT